MIRYLGSVFRAARVHSTVALCLLLRRPVLLQKWLAGSDIAVRDRARYGIHSFIGENGSGKTNVMVRQALLALNRGKKVISTVPLYIDKAAGILHPLYVPFTSWHDLLDAKDCYLLMDEMTGVANARENAPLPGIVQLVLNQLRKRRMVVLWSSPAWEDAQAQIRRLTRAVTVCIGAWPDSAAVLAAGDDYDEAWIPNRLFRARTYRKSGTSGDFTTKGEIPLVDEYYWGPGSSSFNTYDTNEETSRLGQANDFGQCIVCEGNRRRHECSCDDYQTKKGLARTSRTQHNHVVLA